MEHEPKSKRPRRSSFVEVIMRHRVREIDSIFDRSIDICHSMREILDELKIAFILLDFDFGTNLLVVEL